MNDITELREHLFATLKGIRDKDNPLDLDRAKAVAEIAQTIINSAKVEVEFLKEVGGKGSGFIKSEALNSVPQPRRIGGY